MGCGDRPSSGASQPCRRKALSLLGSRSQHGPAETQSVCCFKRCCGSPLFFTAVALGSHRVRESEVLPTVPWHRARPVCLPQGVPEAPLPPFHRLGGGGLGTPLAGGRDRAPWAQLSAGVDPVGPTGQPRRAARPSACGRRGRRPGQHGRGPSWASQTPSRPFGLGAQEAPGAPGRVLGAPSAAPSNRKGTGVPQAGPTCSFKCSKR